MMKTNKWQRYVLTLVILAIALLPAQVAAAHTNHGKKWKHDGPRSKMTECAPRADEAHADLTRVNYTKAERKEIAQAFAKFESFETPYAPRKMTKGDSFGKVVASDDGVQFIFDRMTVNISPRDYAYAYEGETVTLSNGVQAKWYTPDQTPLLSFALKDRFVTISSPDGELSRSQLEKVAVTVAKLR